MSHLRVPSFLKDDSPDRLDEVKRVLGAIVLNAMAAVELMEKTSGGDGTYKTHFPMPNNAGEWALKVERHEV